MNNIAPQVFCQSSAGLPLSCAVCSVRNVSICADLEDAELAALQSSMSHHSVAKNNDLICEFDSLDQLYVVTSGAFRMYKLLEDGRQQITGFAFPGDFIGSKPLGSANYSVEALTDSQVCCFPHSTLNRISTSENSLHVRLTAHSETELTKAYDHMVLLGQKTVYERVATFLCYTAERLGTADSDGSVTLELPMSRRHIADYLAIRSETLSRALRELKDSGLIEEEKGQGTRIPDLDALKAYMETASER